MCKTYCYAQNRRYGVLLVCYLGMPFEALLTPFLYYLQYCR